jgi:predicted CXXCH cytochrome family protein
MKINILLALIGLALFSFFTVLQSQGISNTKHNLSSAGSGSVKASTEGEICVFCHIPHAAAVTPLWNRNNPASYSSGNLYTSSTTNATIGQPDGTSVKCLSCHDGTIALGHVTSRTTDITFSSALGSRRSNLGTDLRDDHPISFVYNAALATADGKLNNPSSLSSGVALDANGKMQCTSCHDPHYSSNTKFLVATNEYSTLCIVCHNDANWTNSTHKSSTSTWNGSSTDPWPNNTYTTVAQNACENCHVSHQAGGAKRILNSATEENNCLPCHSGTVAASGKRIDNQLSKTYKHNVARNSGTHDPTEANIVPSSSVHVECIDCHNPHASNATTASAPNVNGFLKGVKGVDTDGNSVNPSSYEYQICYRCHTTNSTSFYTATPVARQLTQSNVRIEYEPTNPSFHPIESAGRNTSMRSLINGWSSNSIMYCSACHASDGTSSPKGPHGSTYGHILKKQYIVTGGTEGYYSLGTNDAQAQANMETAYALCFDCHSSTRIWDNNSTTASWRYHRLHIYNEQAPCNTCHDPHGVTSETVGGYQNHAHLINFRTGTGYASASGTNFRFEDRGVRTGACYLTCHGENHNGYTY